MACAETRVFSLGAAVSGSNPTVLLMKFFLYKSDNLFESGQPKGLLGFAFYMLWPTIYCPYNTASDLGNRSSWLSTLILMGSFRVTCCSEVTAGKQEKMFHRFGVFFDVRSWVRG